MYGKSQRAVSRSPIASFHEDQEQFRKNCKREEGPRYKPKNHPERESPPSV